MSLTTGSAVPVQAATIDFNTQGELANNFIQGSQFSNSTQFYRQSKTGGITGGSVTGFSGPDYDATAVYQPEESWEKAARAAVERAAQSLRDLRVAEVVEQDLVIEKGKVVAYRTKVKVSFKYEGKD